MLTEKERTYLLENAYIPEHSTDLMTCVSGGEPLLIDDFFCCRLKDRFVFIGYPLGGSFDDFTCHAAIENIKRRYKPKCLSIIAPHLAEGLSESCREKDTDRYYTLDVKPTVSGRLQRIADKASEHLFVERANEMENSHAHLIDEFVSRARPTERVQHLVRKMPAYLQTADGSLLLNARNPKNRLAAFYVVDIAPKQFCTYIIGCHSRKPYAKGASDLLTHTLIQLAGQFGKQYIHLGLGVNPGVRQFKKKWGGKPTLAYEMCELELSKKSVFDGVLSYLRK